MVIKDDIAAANQRLWEAEVEKGCGYTIPWLDLDEEKLLRCARGELDPVPERLLHFYPYQILQEVAGKEVLCLAAGGGQQTAAFALLGATVTVLDLTAGQLRGDAAAAAHYGYGITAVQGDMRDLSPFPPASFDLVFQANSLSYVPDSGEVATQVARVLRPGGRYRVEHRQPALQFAAWDGAGYRITAPYWQKRQQREDGGIEFRHYLDEIFNGLIQAGLTIESVHEAPYANQPLTTEPGSWDHERAYLGGEFAIIARKAKLP